MQIIYSCVLIPVLKMRLQNQFELVQTNSQFSHKILAFDCSPSSLWDPCDSLCLSFLQKSPIKIHKDKFGVPASCIFRFPSQWLQQGRVIENLASVSSGFIPQHLHVAGKCRFRSIQQLRVSPSAHSQKYNVSACRIMSALSKSCAPQTNQCWPSVKPTAHFAFWLIFTSRVSSAKAEGQEVEEGVDRWGQSKSCSGVVLCLSCLSRE